MELANPSREDAAVNLTVQEISGAIGDSATVLPVVVAVAVLTELSLSVMLLWFGFFQVVWGLYYGVPISVEPMKALAALVIAGAVSAGEVVVAGLLLAVMLTTLGATRTLEAVERHVGDWVVRGIQVGVGLVLLETGIGLAGDGPVLALVAGVVFIGVALARSRTLSVFAVFLLGAGIAVTEMGLPTPTLPPVETLLVFSAEFTAQSVEATLAQLAVTVGNAAMATSVLLGDYFDRDISADQLSTSMGAMNALAVPLGGFPMCHGSGGVAGKYAFGARTAGANIVLGVGYIFLALLAVGLVTAYPTAVLGVILILVALQLAWTGVCESDAVVLAGAVGLLSVFVGLGTAFLAGIGVYKLGQILNRRVN
ncbi:sulfate transporter [Halobacteriales archaeon QS_4_62_28]|nr:MAG: sulfate transporter [Halobacteriales archaeon QS_4_62_28]